MGKEHDMPGRGVAPRVRYRARKGSVAAAAVKAGKAVNENGGAALLVVIGGLLLVRCLCMRG